MATATNIPKWPQAFMDFVQSVRYGRNTEALANMLLDPNTATLIAQLPRYQATTPMAQALATTILTQAVGSQQKKDDANKR